MRADRHPQLVRQQIEGGLIWALARTVARAGVGGGDGALAAARAIGLPRIARTPEIQVQTGPEQCCSPRTVRGLGVAVLAPRSPMPFSPHRNRLRNLPFDPAAAG